MGESQPSALGLISSKRDFFETEQRIVEFILSNQADAAGMTLAQLARSSSTSEATVSRFCKRLGFGSYRSFQFSLARDVALAHDDGVTREVSLDDIEQSLRNIQNAKINEIESTIRAIDPATLRSCGDAIRSAGCIQLAAVGNTHAVALDASIKFGQLGLRSATFEVSEAAKAYALTLRPGDVFIAISNSGKSRRLLDTMSAARSAGATCVVITGYPSSPLGSAADLVLQTVNHEALLTTGDFTFSKISAILVVEVLYNFLLPEIDDAREHISTYEELIGEDKDVE